MSKFNRRSFLKAVGVGAGAAMGAGMAPGLLGEARAANTPTGKGAVLVVYLGGGYNALFPSARSFLNQTFGVTAGNTAQVPGGPLVDASFNRLPAAAFNKISTVQINHRSSDHGGAQRNGMTEGAVGFAVQLAAAMGGDASIKMATVGGGNVNGLAGTMNGVSVQNIGDVRSTIDALKGNDTLPDRAISGKAIEQSQNMSAGRLASSPKGLTHLKDGYDTVRATLAKSAAAYDYASILPGYGINNGTAVNNFNSKIAAAELMIRSGTNVVFAIDGGWDTHGDRDGANVRNMMNQRIIPPLITFFNRMWVNNPEPVDRNVNVVIMGDFSRSLPGSDHATGCAATVIGANVKVGGFQQVTANVGFDPNIPSGRGFWSLISSLVNAPGNPFGANAHPGLKV
ncbi:MAG: DUF1501 domain-containing protein [Myxococcales bacterium]|nr:DUF1501 domain-containing protein [Myxococcales bacterium]